MRAVPILALVVVAAVWGWTFVVVRDAVALYPVLTFLSARFILACIVMLPLLLRGTGDIPLGIAPGCALAAGYLCQTLGLRYTSASQAGLLTGLFVVITPLLEFAVHRRSPEARTIAAAIAAFCGTVLLTGLSGFEMGQKQVLGDGLEVMTAVAFAIHLVLLGRASPGRDTTQLALGQFFVCGAGFSVGAVVSRDVRLPDASVVTAVIITGVLATALAFWVQTYVQQRMSPSRTALVLVLEPVFAVLFGFLLAGDRFSIGQAVGAGVILLALIGHEVAAATEPGMSQSAAT